MTSRIEVRISSQFDGHVDRTSLGQKWNATWLVIRHVVKFADDSMSLDARIDLQQMNARAGLSVDYRRE